MGKEFDRVRHTQIAAHLAGHESVSGCQMYPGMLEVTPEFDRFAREHSSMIDDLAWCDICPAYALGLMTFDTYDLPEDDADLEALWEEVGTSDISWHQARSVILDVWIWLGEREMRALPVWSGRIKT